MKRSEFVANLHKICADALALVDKKNQDYATETDPFQNFRMAQLVGVDPARAILVRVSDKLSRISNLIGKDTVAVKDESVRDTILDMINYLAILQTYLEQEKNLK